MTMRCRTRGGDWPRSKRFRRPRPALWSRAPGRVDLMGSHTDYNLGYVLTLAISRDTWVAARPAPRRERAGSTPPTSIRRIASISAIPVRSADGARGATIPRRGLGARKEGLDARRLRRRDSKHGAVPQRAGFVRRPGMRHGRGFSSPGRLATRREREWPSLPARRKRFCRAQLRHSRPVHILRGPRSVRPVARLQGHFDAPGATRRGTPRGDLRHAREA